MGKSKKKKQKNADFQKVKLKVGKSKPVGTNVTNTAFHSSTIHIGTQFETGSEPVNRKKLSLKDLLNQLNHYNVNVRHDALDGLRDLFQTHPVVMHEQLSIWLSKVLSKITDLDPSVRHSLNVCLNHAFATLLELEVSPFFKIIITHICCGLTHINEGIQVDCLDILGIIIDKYPSSFIPFSNKVLEHVIDLISKKGSKGSSGNQSKGGKTAKGISALVSRQLTSNADSTFKTRTKILEQMYNIIKVFRLPENKVRKEETEKDAENVVYVTSGSPAFVQLFKYGLNPTPVQNIEMETWLEMGEWSKMINSSNNFENLISKIFPLILNIWVEYEPNKLSANLNDLHFSRALLPGIKVIIDILDILLDPQQTCDDMFHKNVYFLYKSFSKELSLHFFSTFVLPIHSKSSSNKSIKTGNPDTVQKCSIHFNFLMAKIICSLLKQSHDGNNLVFEAKQRISYIRDLTSFITVAVDLNSLIIDDDKVLQLLFILDDILLVKRTGDKKEADLIDSSSILRKILEVYKMACLSSPWKLPLFTFFTKYTIEDRYKRNLDDNVRSRQLKEFMESVIVNVWSLPSSSENLISKSLEFIKLILVRNFIDASLFPSLSNSLIEMTNPSGLFRQLNEKLRRCIIEIVFHIDIPETLLRNLAFICHLDTVSLAVKKYIISVVGYCTHQKENSLELHRYLNFILSVIVGFSMDDLLKFNVESPNFVSWSILNIFPNKLKQMPIDYAIAQLDQLNGLDSALSIFVPVISRFLIQLRKLPVTAALGLVKIFEYFSSRHGFQHGCDTLNSLGSEINQIADLLSAVLLYSISSTYKSVSGACFNENDDKQLVLEDELVFSSITLLISNQMLLRLLIKKWINVLGEYKMNAVCVNSIIEVLIELLKDPKLLPLLSEFKDNLQSIVNAFYSVCLPQIEKHLVEQLRMQVMLL